MIVSKVWINQGDIILLSLREYQDEKADVLLKYNPDEARSLKQAGELPDTTKINEVETFGGEEEDEIEFEFDIDEVRIETRRSVTAQLLTTTCRFKTFSWIIVFFGCKQKNQKNQQNPIKIRP